MNNRIDSIEIHQDLFLNFREEIRMKVRQELRKHAKSPWYHAEKREKDIGEDVMAFERKAEDGLPYSGLALWTEPYGYKVVNIVPLEAGDISISLYNDILNDFIDRVVRPASNSLELDIEISARRQSITDWTSQEAADALHRFAVTANKSTGSGHPSDRGRWFEFLFAARRAPKKFDTYFLGRWLVEVEEWPPEVVTDLVNQYQFTMDLLDKYDPNSRNRKIPT